MTDLSDHASALFTPGKGILAADESNDSADKKRLVPYGITPGEEMRQKFRDLFLNAPGVEQYLSGVILYEETLAQKGNDGIGFAQSLLTRGIIPGIKVDEGLEPFPDSPNETLTQGLLGLPERLAGYAATYHTGFTKWRAAIKIEGDKLPTRSALHENAKRLAQYACEAQKAGMVPMVEPEVLLEGTHSRLRSKEVLTETLQILFAALEDQAADITGIILKTSMVVSGSKSGKTDTPQEVAQDTMEVLLQNVPALVPGIVFLSGGQTPDQATENLRAICAYAESHEAPWPLTFSFARALQEEALEVWKGEDANVSAAREVFLSRLKKVSEARLG